jgi:hypothetical protein
MDALEVTMDRRDFLKRTGLAGAAIAAGGLGNLAGAGEPEEKPRPMPKIRLGSLEVSRLLLGTNPFFGFAHRPGPIGGQMKEWYTDERIVAALDEAAANGIDVVVGPPYARWQALWKRYREGGGKLLHWISQPDRPPEKIPEEIEESVKAGASAVYIQGHKVEAMFEADTFEVVRGWVDAIRKLGVPAGIGSHRTDCHLEAQRRGFPVDFYFQCLFNVAHGDSFEKGDPEKAAAVIQKLEKPVVAYKILGAGRVPGPEGFEFAFRNIRAKDGVCVGVYTGENPRQIVENAALARKFSPLSADPPKAKAAP